ncbi:hypothetical protein HN51_069690 [Arachis hypogaea]
MRARARDQRVRGGHRRNAAAAAAIAVVEEGVWRRERKMIHNEMEREDKDATRERRRLFHRALSSLLGSIEAAAAARACRAPVLTFGFYDYFLHFIGAVFDAKEAYQQRMASMMEQVQIRDSFKLQRQLDTYFLLAHMCSVKLKEWTLVLFTSIKKF